jgi:Flp pilus assembly protein TadG
MRVRRRRATARGQTLVEFALIAPIFFLILFGIIDIGRYVYVTTAFNQAAREGARFGSVEQWSYACPVGTSPQTRFTCSQEFAKRSLAGAPATFSVTATCSTTNCRAGDIFTVRVETPSGGSGMFKFFTPIIGQLISPPVIVGEAKVEIQ